MDFLEGTPPLLIALTGLVTFTAVLVGCVYTRQKTSKREESSQIKEKGRDEPEGSADVLAEGNHPADVPHGNWPVGKQKGGGGGGKEE